VIPGKEDDEMRGNSHVVALYPPTIVVNIDRGLEEDEG
jgi:hypothetical protein